MVEKTDLVVVEQVVIEILSTMNLLVVEDLQKVLYHYKKDQLTQ